MVLCASSRRSRPSPVVAEKKKPKKSNGGNHAQERVIVFEYIKSELFRVIHADGAIGGITPQGNIHFALFSERAAIPRVLMHEANPDGSLGKALPDRSVVRPGLIREMDVDVVMSLATAEPFAAWLEERIAELKKRLKKAGSDE